MSGPGGSGGRRIAPPGRRELVPPGHRLGEQVRRHPSGRGRPNGCGEEVPGMRPVPGARSLDCDGQADAGTGVGESRNFGLPLRLVEVHGHEPAGLVDEKGIAADDVPPLEVIQHDVVRDRDERLGRTVTTTNPGLVADPAHPLVAAGGRVTLPAGLRVHPESREDVLPSTEQAPEQRDLAGRVEARFGQRCGGSGPACGRIQPLKLPSGRLEESGDSIGPVSKVAELDFEGVDRGEEPSPLLLFVGHLRRREQR